MRLLTIILILAGLLTVILSGALKATAAEYPNVVNLKSYSVQANYMSLPGYLRYLVYEKDNVWITFGEAKKAVKSQLY